jgi:dTDP-4-amino-4,6-dideoxygalactose transaminase
VPTHCVHNGHLYYLLMRNQSERDHLIQSLGAEEIGAPFHYVPLHSSPAGLRHARTQGDLAVTDSASAGLIRLPLHAGIAVSAADRVIDSIHAILKG